MPESSNGYSRERPQDDPESRDNLRTKRIAAEPRPPYWSWFVFFVALFVSVWLR
jgi:hypothetical protein